LAIVESWIISCVCGANHKNTQPDTEWRCCPTKSTYSRAAWNNKRVLELICFISSKRSEQQAAAGTYSVFFWSLWVELLCPVISQCWVSQLSECNCISAAWSVSLSKTSIITLYIVTILSWYLNYFIIVEVVD